MRLKCHALLDTAVLPSIAFVGSLSLFIWQFFNVQLTLLSERLFFSYNVTTWSETHSIPGHTVAVLYTSSWGCQFSSRTLALCNKIWDAFLSLLQSSVLFSEIKPLRYNIYLLSSVRFFFVDCSWHSNSKKLSSDTVVFKIYLKFHQGFIDFFLITDSLDVQQKCTGPQCHCCQPSWNSGWKSSLYKVQNTKHVFHIEQHFSLFVSLWNKMN